MCLTHVPNVCMIFTYLQSSIWNNLHPNQVIGQAAVIKEIDCLTATVDEIREVRAQVMLPISLDGARLAALAGWFDVHFRVRQTNSYHLHLKIEQHLNSRQMLITFHNTFQGSKQNPAVEEVVLNTAPDEHGGTHWGQQVCFLSVFLCHH
jgi:type I protein arginine methyltransferase